MVLDYSHNPDGPPSLSPLTIEEREQALGYRAGCTAAYTATYETRHRVTGAAFDANSVSTILAVSLAIRDNGHPSLPYSCTSTAPVSELGGEM